jgi:GTP-binding protein LepA
MSMNQQNIRNFAIIAHIDHGKSTLSDRLLELTNTIAKDKMQEQFLDQNPISRERGITIKLAPVRMIYKVLNPKSEFRNSKQIQNINDPNSKKQSLEHSNFKHSDLFRASDFDIRIYEDSEFILNLIDTPGHVDFSYEVSRTLAACEGAVLLVDATQGIQAQTVAHFHEAKKAGLIMIPVLNKIDLPNVQIEIVKKELVETFNFKEEEIITISAKSGENVGKLLQLIVEKLPSPRGKKEDALRALIFDAVYDEYRGVVTYVRLIDGTVKTGDEIMLYQNGVKSIVTEVGYFSPFLTKSDQLSAGDIGYIITGIKDIRNARVGDTIVNSKLKTQNSKLITDNGKVIEPLPGYTIPKPMVFFGMYPKEQDDFPKLKESLGKLILNDTSLSFNEEYSAYLGSGFRVGFLGLLHAEIVKERLQQEFGLDLLLTMPQVLYKKSEDGMMTEPYMVLSVYTPKVYVGGIMSVCQKKKGDLIDMQYHEAYSVLKYEMPFSMFIRGLSSDLKSVTSGYASIDYEVIEYRPANLVKLEILINTNPIDVLSELVYRDEAAYIAREKTAKLKESLTRQQFRQIIQASVDNAIVARTEIPPFRKDVLAKMSGGDRTRKDKLLEAQKKGKKRMLSTGKISLSQEALFSMIERQ